MKKFLPLIAALTAVFCISCQETEPDQSFPGDPVRMVFKAYAPSSEATKTHLGTASGTSTPVLWEDDDCIAVWDGTAVRKFTVLSGTNKGTYAEFVGEAIEGRVYKAAYPYDGAEFDSTLSGGEGGFVVTVPQVQTVGEYSVADGAIISTASTATAEGFKFRNASALMRVSVEAGVKKVIISTLDGTAIAGKDATSVTLMTPGTAGSYEVSIKPGTYEGLCVLTDGAAGGTVKQTATKVTLGASQIINLGAVKGTAASIISTADELKSFLASAGSISNACVANDIDLTGVSYSSANSFAGKLCGLGHSLKNAGTPLFSSLSGEVSDLVFEGNTTVSGNQFAPVAIASSGAIKNVTNRMSVTKTVTADITDPVLLAGIAIASSGSISNCRNEAAITFSSTGEVNGVAVGGIVAYGTGALENCTNKGDVTLECKSMKNLSEYGAIKSFVPCAGGISAMCHSGFTAKGCRNEGTITAVSTAIAVSASLSFRMQFGGIVGAGGGNIDDCHNAGAINVRQCSADGSVFSSYSYIIGVGGISGGDYLAPSQNATNITNCTNSGAINCRIDSSSGNSTVGGIVGWPGVESTALTVKVTGCTNSAPITVSGAGKVRAGGITGGSGNIGSSANSGKITYAGTNTAGAIGGISGFHSQNHQIGDCTNTGDVVNAVAAMTGGIIGNQGNASNSFLNGCRVNCTVSSADMDFTMTGMVVGKWNGTSAIITLGTEASPINVAGKIGSNPVFLIHKGNFQDYLAGTSSTSANHKFYAVCDTEIPEPSSIAQGYVKWTDGTAVEGVAVSDGFTVAATDATGYYKLATTSDSYYIYISIPENAKVDRDIYGRPAFFQRYSSMVTDYNFTLEKQAVETKFRIFAMADPQAHYVARNPQKLADTKRFQDEAVPSINRQIAASSVPSYGVTLGDIVYSEGSRNSNPGMTVMRTGFQMVNMPVFQVMGNHDFTYFYGTSNPLTTDAQSSTTQLKVSRKFEDAFGPVNYSFNRGQVHVVCMKDIYFNSTTDAADYTGAFTNEQYNWLKADLALVPKTKKVIFCVHIPMLSCSGHTNVDNVMNLLKQYTNTEIFSGHTHSKRGYPNCLSSGIYEHVHSAVCGQWWWSNIEGDGCPNGFTVYTIEGTDITNEYFVGQNAGMDDPATCQMRIYRGGLSYGGKYCYFANQLASNVLQINLFNGDSRWKSIAVYENGVFKGNASLMAYSRTTFASVTTGSTYAIPAASSQDWWAIGYHIGELGRGRTSTSYYTSNFHMYKYTMTDASASIKVVATDMYGNQYTCTDVISSFTGYPDYIIAIK